MANPHEEWLLLLEEQHLREIENMDIEIDLIDERIAREEIDRAEFRRRIAVMHSINEEMREAVRNGEEWEPNAAVHTALAAPDMNAQQCEAYLQEACGVSWIVKSGTDYPPTEEWNGKLNMPMLGLCVRCRYSIGHIWSKCNVIDDEGEEECGEPYAKLTTPNGCLINPRVCVAIIHGMDYEVDTFSFRNYRISTTRRPPVFTIEAEPITGSVKLPVARDVYNRLLNLISS